VKLVSKYSILCDHATWTTDGHTDGRMDGRTEDILWHNRALA